MTHGEFLGDRKLGWSHEAGALDTDPDARCSEYCPTESRGSDAFVLCSILDNPIPIRVQMSTVVTTEFFLEFSRNIKEYSL